MAQYQLPNQIRAPRPDEMRKVRDIEEQAFPTEAGPTVTGSSGSTSAVAHDQYRVLTDGHEVRAQLRLIPLDTWVRGRHFAVAGISRVASPPQHRRRGATRQLLVELLKELHQRDIPIAMLYPFSYEFYRRLGWEVGALVLQYQVHLSDLASFLPGRGRIVSVPGRDTDQLAAYLPGLDMLYHRYAARYSCMLLRDAVHWRERVLAREGRPQRAYIWQDDDGDPEGYIIYDWDNQRETNAPLLRVREWVALSPAARQGLLGFLANHDSQAQRACWYAPADDTLLLEMSNPRQEARLEPSFMIRLVNVAQALNALWQRQLDDPPPPLSERLGDGATSTRATPGAPAEGSTTAKSGGRRQLLFTLAVTDALCPWNQVPLEVWVTPDGWQALPARQGRLTPPDLEGDIQTLAQLFTGVLRVEQAVAAGRLRENRLGAAAQLAVGLPPTEPFMSDRF